MALHLEDDRIAIADIDDAGVFTRSLDYPRRACRQLLEMDARGLVAAVLAPHDRENAEFGQVGRAVQDPKDMFPLVFGKAVVDGMRQG